MEICYDGALVMPKNYAVVDEEEMEYVDGGEITLAAATAMIGGLIAVVQLQLILEKNVENIAIITVIPEMGQQ